MQAVLYRILEVAQAVVAAGSLAAGGLLAAGLLFLVLGFRAYRPSAALIGALVAAVTLSDAVRHWQLHLPTSLELTLAAASLTAFAVGLVYPGLISIASAGAIGFLISSRVALAHGPDDAFLIIVAGPAIGVAVSSFFYEKLGALVPPPIGAVLAVLGAWGLYGIERPKGMLFRVLFFWLLIAWLVMLCSWMIELVRLRRYRADQLARQIRERGRT